jgi:hypothetical protein
MSAASELHLGQPMSWEEYGRLGEDVRAGYIDGRAVTAPSPRQHVLSSNRADDLVRTTQKDAAVTLPHYWIADPLFRRS